MKALTRVFIALLTLISGGYLLLLCLLVAPSSWYSVAALLVAVSGIAGLFRLEAIGGIALPSLLMASPLILSANVWNKESTGLLLALAFAWTGALASVFLSGKTFAVKVMKYSAISSVILALGFGVDRAFTNKVQLHDYEMNWSVGSNDPLNTGPDMIQGQTKVVIYRKDGDSTCYEALYSNELANYLATFKKARVHVQYEVFYDFGKSRAYNVRSIEGMIVTRDTRPVLKVADSQGGTIQGPNATGQCDR
jgi:hypothetical protein